MYSSRSQIYQRASTKRAFVTNEFSVLPVKTTLTHTYSSTSSVQPSCAFQLPHTLLFDFWLHWLREWKKIICYLHGLLQTYNKYNSNPARNITTSCPGEEFVLSLRRKKLSYTIFTLSHPWKTKTIIIQLSTFQNLAPERERIIVYNLQSLIINIRWTCL